MHTLCTAHTKHTMHPTQTDPHTAHYAYSAHTKHTHTHFVHEAHLPLWQGTEGGADLKQESVDAVVLDLPAPYLCVEAAHRVLKKNANFCSFSPCIEQVQRTCDELRRLGFEGRQLLHEEETLDQGVRERVCVCVSA